ncbi:hypothetical protein BJY04DRAFT_55039 [Aspergillus karnatakaensis]|uniref:uncharacterized protein n=1 Tax=Aspergillus karnatakaensis TaxID=1810916 RepID=UPI003CCCC068
MGTRGLVFIRCNGRIYVYYNHWDSYPDGLGDAIIALIPKDSEKYQEWLEKLRQTYTRLTHQFESQILCVSPEFGQPGGLASRSERYTRSYLALDDRLDGPPTQTLLADDLNIFIEWTYTIDLDRELFVVDRAAAFKLSMISQYPGWDKFLATDARGRRILDKKTPPDLVGTLTHDIKVDEALREVYRTFAIDHGLHNIVDLSNSVSKNPSREALLVKAISAVCGNYRDLIDGFYPEWTSASFAFQEIAFAILSFAAGEITFKSPHELNRSYSREGFYLLPNTGTNGQQTLLPRFLYECCNPGGRPGSAPQGNPFWLGNILVLVAPRINLVDFSEAAIAQVVKSGLSQGLTSFRASVFSILNFILLDVRKGKNGVIQVTRSPIENLVYFDDTSSKFANGPRSHCPEQKSFQSTSKLQSQECGHNAEFVQETEDAEGAGVGTEVETTGSGENIGEQEETEGGNEEDEEVEQDLQHVEDADYDSCDDVDIFDLKRPDNAAGLAAIKLIRFFDTTANQHLATTRSRVLPNEILNTIMEFSDHPTYLALAQVSACCRNLYYQNFRLNDDYALVRQDCDPLTSSFTLKDLATDQIMTSTFGRKVDRRCGRNGKTEAEVNLSPIIGIKSPNRMSILDAWRFTLSGILPKRPAYEGKRDMPTQVSYHYCSHPNGPEPERLFKLADYLYPGSLEDAFGRYILSLVQGMSQGFSYSRIDNARFPCLRPLGYRELVMEPWFCSGLHMFLRPKQCETAEEWAKMVDYAVTRLRANEEETKYYNPAVAGAPVVVAFHRKVKLFYYVYERANPVAVTGSSPHCAKIAEKCTETNPRRRIVNLIPGDQPISLDDQESRELFEVWIRSFCSADSKLEAWDPFSNAIVSIASSRNEDDEEKSDGSE